VAHILPNQSYNRADFFMFRQAFIDARYKNGTGLSDDEITGMLIAVLFAGQHTSSITSTWAGLHMLAHKKMVWPQAEEEQRKVLVLLSTSTLYIFSISSLYHLHMGGPAHARA
jgi:sterol 14-demethylase